jgi:hypothetical protein
VEAEAVNLREKGVESRAWLRLEASIHWTQKAGKNEREGNKKRRRDDDERKQRAGEPATPTKQNYFQWVFLFSNLWGRLGGDHPQEDLAKFSYKWERKVEKKMDSSYILATDWNLFRAKLQNFFLLIMWWLGVHLTH